jgi:dihydrofolate reductase
MRKLGVFNQISLDGFFCDVHDDMSWAHKSDPEWNAWVAENAGGGGALVFGRVTYEMMAAYWPTPMARRNDPVVAERMTAMEKIVFSRSLRKPALTWANTRVVEGDAAKVMRALKKEKGPDMVILGSGTLVAALTDANLVDAYTVVVNPLVLGGGRTMFDGVKRRAQLTLTSTRAFENGNVALRFERAKT